MIKLLKNAEVLSPDRLGMKDILVAGDKIAMIADNIDLCGLPVETADMGGLTVVPGFIDRHVHVTGGGGQQGFVSLAPEVTVSELVALGDTTVVGMLGTDGFVKTLAELYAKVQAINDDGLSAYMLTNYYGLPERTITGSVAEDLIYIEPVIGCKIAISDERSSFPDEKELLRLINGVKLGGFTSGKGGFLHIHLGALDSGIDALLSIARRYPGLIRYMSPTHMIRTELLFEQSIEFALSGGTVDYSTGGTRFRSPHECVMEALARGVDIDAITLSSDGHGGVRRVNPVDGTVTYTPAPMDGNLREVKMLVNECGLGLDRSIRLITSSPARHMNLRGKGRVAPGYDADLCMLDENMDLVHVMARGQWAMRDGNVELKGRYEI